MSLLSSNPNPALNEEEVALLELQPEECLQSAVRRGAISLDETVGSLSSQMAAIVRSIATGERLPDLPELEETPSPGYVGLSDAQRDDLSVYPHLQRLVDENKLNVWEATEIANMIDRALGRYLTGTKYAAP